MTRANASIRELNRATLRGAEATESHPSIGQHQIDDAAESRLPRFRHDRIEFCLATWASPNPIASARPMNSTCKPANGSASLVLLQWSIGYCSARHQLQSPVDFIHHRHR
jgi:hypothetical protein